MWKLVTTRRAVAAATTTTTSTTTACRSVARRALSSADLSHLVSNVTFDKIAADPELEAFMKANYPQAMNPNYVPVEPPHKKGQPRRRAAAGSSLAVATDDAIPQQESSESSYPRNIRPLTTYWRDPETESNSRRSRYLRHHRLIPGIIYGKVILSFIL